MSNRPRSLNPSCPTIIESLCWWIGLVFIALFLTAIQMTITSPFGLTTLELLAHFQAVEPFQHRILVPAMAAGVEHVLPVDHRLVFGVIEMGFWIALVVLADHALAVMDIVRTPAWRRSVALTLLLPVAIVVLLPDLQLWPAFSHESGRLDFGAWGARTLFYYPYDLPAAVFTLALFLGLVGLRHRFTRGRAVALIALFVLATFNRETTLFLLPLAICLLAVPLGPRRLLLLVGPMTLLFLAIEPTLQWWFSDQPNPNREVPDSQYEWHIIENWNYLSQPFYSATEIVRFLGGLWLPVVLWWRFVDRRLRLALLVFVIPLVIVGLIVGRLAEHRVFIEAIPLVWLAAVQAMSRRLGAPLSNEPSAVPPRQTDAP